MRLDTSIAERERKIVDEFNLFDDWMGRYEYLIELGGELPLIEDEFKTDEFKIRGCQAQVWLRPEYRDGRIYFRADSDAMITKGLIALLIEILNGQRPADIADAPLDFLDEIGMKEHLSSTRKNGLASMITQIKDYARSVAPEAHMGTDGITQREAGTMDTDRPGTRDRVSADLGAEDLGMEDSGAGDRERHDPDRGDSQAGDNGTVREEDVVEAIRTVFDPEIPVNVYDLGLIYEIRVNPDSSVFVLMTLTAPNCPAAGFLPGQVELVVGSVEGVSDARVEVTFDPPFSMDMMSDEARLELGLL